MQVGVDRQPSIHSHRIHAGDNEINWYCHLRLGKHSGIPSLNVCELPQEYS
jgi:hypothetical protein